MKNSRLVGAAVAGGLAVAIAPYAITRVRNVLTVDTTQGGADPVQNISASRDTPPGNSIGGAATTPARYDYKWASSEALLNVDTAYIISKLGPARETYPEDLAFRVDGCDVTYGIKEGKVKSITLTITQACQPIVAGKQINPTTRFNQIADFSLEGVTASCLFESCGNSSDPIISYAVPGYHANNWVGYEYTAAYSGSADQAWLGALSPDQIKTMNDAQDSGTDSGLDDSHPPVSVRATIGRLTIASVEIKAEF